MKKVLISLIALMLANVQALAFEFDGINLNDDHVKITRAITTKSYVFDPSRNCLKGNCQGTDIFLSFNLDDVNTKGKVGQMYVEIPMKDENAAQNCTELPNVIYHQIGQSDGGIIYSVGSDGTTLTLQKQEGGIKLTYTTPYYKKKK